MADLRFSVLKGNGDLMYGVPNREPGAQDVGETLRVVLGQRDVPLGVERALIGASRGSRRRVELPPASGFASSDWRPKPAGFAGQQRIERFKRLLTGNGLQRVVPRCWFAILFGPSNLHLGGADVCALSNLLERAACAGPGLRALRDTVSDTRRPGYDAVVLFEFEVVRVRKVLDPPN